MSTISMLEFRRDAQSILRRVCRGEAFVLTYRGRQVARIEPVASGEASTTDPIYHLFDFAEDAQSLSNDQMDSILYGES
ncbi:MAG: type II toxin-antitoxin system Phd/YefM family antitoxin [Planctomycetales bacterium]